MKRRITFLISLALLCCLLPTCAQPFRSMSASAPAPPDLFSASDLVGTWIISEIYIDSASESSMIQWGTVEIASDGSATAEVTTLNGTDTHTFAVTINGAGEIFFDGVRKAVMSYDKTEIIGSELVETYAGLFVAGRAPSTPDFSQADCEGTWRVHSLQAGSDWEGWSLVDGSIDAEGSFTGTRNDSDGGSSPYAATVTLEPDDTMQIAEPGNSMVQIGGMSSDRLSFGCIMGVNDDTEDIGRFDIGVRTGGDFITADLEGKWWYHTVCTSGMTSHGYFTCESDGTGAGEDTWNDGTTHPTSVAMHVTSDGQLTIDGANGQGTLGLDRSFFAFSFTDDTGERIMLATKHPTEVASMVDVTQVAMNWGNGFSFDDPMDLDAVGLPCDLPGVWVDQSYFQAVPPPAQGSSVQAAYVYGHESDLQTPTFVPGKLTLGSGLSSSGDRTRSRFMPELAMESMIWPNRTGDIELWATFDNFQGDLAPLVGDGFRGVDLGFSVINEDGWWSDAWLSFGFVTMYVPDGTTEIPSGYYNRQPFLSFGSYNSGSENTSVMPATGYNPAYPVQLKVVITMANLARFYAHFGPPEAEWTQLGEQHLDWWPGAGTPAGGCGTSAGDSGLTWYSPYVSSTLEYLNVSEPSGPLEIVTDSLPDGTAGNPYNQSLEATGGEPPYEWQIVSGNLPPGISLSADGDLSGTCYDTGIYTFTVGVTDDAEEAESVEREYTLTMNENMYHALAGEWHFTSITVDRTVRSAGTAYGAMIFDQSGNVSVYRFALDGAQTTMNLTYTIDADGQISIAGKPWGTLSFDGKRILANKYDAQTGTLTICHRFEAGQSFSQYDAEGSWTTHSFEVGPDWQGWRWVTDGEIDGLGEYTGTQFTSDGDSDSYSATVTVADNGLLTLEEPGNALLQRYGISESCLGFGGIMGDMETPGIGRFDVSVRTGGDFITEDLEGKWWFYGIGTTGFIMRGRFLVDADGTYTGEFFDSVNETTEPISGTMAVTPEGDITIEANGEVLDGHFTLGMDRSFFAGTSSADDHSMLVATKRIETIASQVDITHVYMDWGNGFGFDDPLTLDTLGNPCGIPGMSVDDSYFTHPTLPEGGVASALYGFWNSPDAAPAFEDGKLVFTSTMPPSGDPATAGMSPQISLNNVPWEPQTSNVELRVTFENLQGALTTMAGYGGVALDIGFRVSDGDNEVGTVWAQLAISTVYAKRGFSGVEPGYYNRQPFAVMGNEGDMNWAFQVSPVDGYDPGQPTELKITVSPSGQALGYVRCGTQGEWVGIGDMQLSFWPEPGAWTNGCYSPSLPPGTLRYTPYITYRLENVELPGEPRIMPETLPSGIAGSDYEQQLYSEDGFPPFEWWIEDGELPPGLDLDEGGLISGTLGEAGSYQFTVRVEDSQSPSASCERTYEIQVIQPVSIQGAKALPDGTQVALTNVIISRKGERGFYVEEPDRSAGIYVKWSDGFIAEGWTVEVEGVLETDDDFERRVVAFDVRRFEETTPMTAGYGGGIRPIGMAIRNLGGSDFQVDPDVPTSGQRGVTGGAGLNNIGLLVKTWGRVTWIDPDGQYFYISDGSTVMDGTQTGGIDSEGVRVGRDPLGLRPGDYVTVVGVSSCFRGPGDTVCRGIRGQDMSPSIQVHFPGPPQFVLGMPGQDPLNSCTIIFSSVLGASGYRLYQSTDGQEYSPVSGEPDMQGDYGIFLPSLSGNTYFQVCALDGDGDEGAHSQTVYARVQDPAGLVPLTAPPNGQTDAPLDPSVCWNPVPGAVRMGIELYHEDGSHQTDWGAFFPAGDGCVPYGQMGRPLTYAPALDVLQPFTDYWVYVYAVDSGNWAFASSPYWPFTTGDGTGGGGGGDIPPPPPI